jgi:hypothetical protein
MVSLSPSECLISTYKLIAPVVSGEIRMPKDFLKKSPNLYVEIRLDGFAMYRTKGNTMLVWNEEFCVYVHLRLHLDLSQY